MIGNARLLAAVGCLLCLSCKPSEPPSPSGAVAKTAAAPSPLAPVPIPSTPGVAGSVLAKGKTVELRHVYAREMPDLFDDKTTMAVLLLSDRPLDVASLSNDVWKYYGQGADFQGMGFRIRRDGSVGNLLVKHPDVGGYQESGSSMNEFHWDGSVVKGRKAAHGESEGVPWSYAVAFHADMKPAPAAKPTPAPKKR